MKRALNIPKSFENVRNSYHKIFAEVKNFQESITNVFITIRKNTYSASFRKTLGRFLLWHIINYLLTEFAFRTVKYQDFGLYVRTSQARVLLQDLRLNTSDRTKSELS